MIFKSGVRGVAGYISRVLDFKSDTPKASLWNNSLSNYSVTDIEH